MPDILNLRVRWRAGKRWSFRRQIPRRVRAVSLLALIEPMRPRPYAGPAALFCSEDSFLNPLRPGGTGLAPFDETLTGGYSVDTVPGPHGATCEEPIVQFLAHHLVRRVEIAAARTAVHV